MGGSEKATTVESEEDEVFEVEKLLRHRRSATDKNQVEYLIKWKDYDNVYNSWEKEEDIFSKGLVLEYWSKQPYTLATFRNQSHDKLVIQKLAPVTLKKRPSPSASMLEIEKKRKLDDIKSSQLTAEPPKGLTWDDITCIVNVFHCGSNTYFAEVRWTRPDTVSYIPTRCIRRFNPLKLIYFYESNTDFYPKTAA